MLAAIRPDSWNLPLFLHVLGAMVLAGGTGAVVVLGVGRHRYSQHELVGALVVEVDEARVGAERFGDFPRDEREHLLEIERRVDRLDRLGQQAQMAF